MTKSFDPFLDATAQAELVRSGELSPAELVEAAIKRIDTVNPALNAIVIPLFDKARAEAERAAGPFRGVPYVIKDLTLVSKGDLHTASIAGVKRAGLRPDIDSYFVERMRAAGFVLVGKTSTPEMGINATTEPDAWGQTRNPWDRTLSAGGSSGGSASAVAAALVPVAHGNDGGGSIRQPSSVCGVVGLKPTRGRIPAGPFTTETDSAAGMAHEGLLARSVRDIAGMLDAVNGHAPGDTFSLERSATPFREHVGAEPGRLRIGVLAEDPIGEVVIHPDCYAGVRRIADVLADVGHDVTDDFPAILKTVNWPPEVMACIDVTIMREIEHYGTLIGHELTEDDVETATWGFVTRGRDVTGAQFAAGLDALRLQARETERWWVEAGFDLLLSPTIPSTPPPPLGDKLAAEVAPGLSLNLTVPYNVSGQPAISLPLCASTDGMPIGIQLVGGFGREDVLLRAASQLEVLVPWADRRPPVG